MSDEFDFIPEDGDEFDFVEDDAPAAPPKPARGFVAGVKEANAEADSRAQRDGSLATFSRLVAKYAPGSPANIPNYVSGVVDEPGRIKDDLLTLWESLKTSPGSITALPSIIGGKAGELPAAQVGEAIKGDRLGELWSQLKHDAGRTVASGGMDPKRPVLSPLDTLSAGSIATKAPAVASAIPRAVSRGASKLGRGFKVKSLTNELGELAKDVKNTRSLERAVKQPAKHAGELKSLHQKLLRSEKDMRRLKPEIQRAYRKAWDAKRANDPAAKLLYDDAFKKLMSDERTPAIETRRAAMKIKEGDSARALLDDSAAIEGAMKNRQLAQSTHGDAVKMLDELGPSGTAEALEAAQKWAGRTGSVGAIATGASTGNLPAAAAVGAAGYGGKALLGSAPAMGGAASLFYKIAGKSNVAARKLAGMGITGASAPEKVAKVHALLSVVDPEYAAEVGDE